MILIHIHNKLLKVTAGKIVRITDSEFKESDHPRADNGQFGTSGGHITDPDKRRAGHSKPTTLRLNEKSENKLNDAQAYWYDNLSDKEKEASFSIQKIKLSDLTTVQFGVNNRKVKNLSENFDPSLTKELPWVDMINGVPVISDGNHRVEAAINRGEKELEFNVRDLTGAAKSAPVGYRNEPPPKTK